MDASERKYGRNDVDYATWYSEWSKQLAMTKTRAELEIMRDGAASAGRAASRAHLRAIERTSSMQGCSQARAQTGNVSRASGDTSIALSGALEIYDLFPEHTLQGAQVKSPRAQVEAGIAQALAGMGVTARSVGFQDSKVSVSVETVEAGKATATALRQAGIKKVRTLKMHDGGRLIVGCL